MATPKRNTAVSEACTRPPSTHRLTAPSGRGAAALPRWAGSRRRVRAAFAAGAGRRYGAAARLRSPRRHGGAALADGAARRGLRGVCGVRGCPASRAAPEALLEEYRLLVSALSCCGPGLRRRARCRGREALRGRLPATRPKLSMPVVHRRCLSGEARSRRPADVGHAASRGGPPALLLRCSSAPERVTSSLLPPSSVSCGTLNSRPFLSVLRVSQSGVKSERRRVPQPGCKLIVVSAA